VYSKFYILIEQILLVLAMTKVLPWRKGMMIGAAVLLLALIAAAPMASAAGWSYYKTITIDKSKVQGTLTNFPVLINITDSNLASSAQSDGDDIVFTDNANSVKLDHEIEEFNKSTGKLVAWVRIPSLSSGSDYTMRMYYGNSECGNQQNPTGVWDTYYKMVQHLEETEDQPTTDSTANHNNGTVGEDSQVNQNATGKIDGADDFEGTGNSYVEVADSSSLDITGSFTLEAWAKFDEFPDALKQVSLLVCKGDDASTGYCMGVNSSHELRMKVGSSNHFTSSSGITTGTWYHIVSVFNHTSNSVAVYVNGNQKLSESTTGSLSATAKTLRIGACSFSAPCAGQTDGIIDEVRVSNTARSADWIVTSYNNQNTPGVGGFLSTIGSQTSASGQQPVPELPTLLLFSLGLIALAGYVHVRKRK
jgi:hypothetical protein